MPDSMIDSTPATKFGLRLPRWRKRELEFFRQSRSLKGMVRLAREVRRIEKELAGSDERTFHDHVSRVFDAPESKSLTSRDWIRCGGVIAEAVFRTHGFRLHDVQLQAMIGGASGAVVEMQTGEGKTVVTGATAAMKLLTAGTVHVGTTNTYLAARDLEDMQGTFDLLGISYGLLPEESNEAASRRAYRNQIVYGPGYQYGFDYLRDQMNLRNNRQSILGMSLFNRIRGRDPYTDMIQPDRHEVALIDEADSVMIDEAMTPLVISMPGKNLEDPTPYYLAKKITTDFVEGDDYTIKMPDKNLQLTDAANQRGHDAVADQRQLKLARPWRMYLSNALKARLVFQRNVDYVVVDDKVQIVDQYTGRIFADRTWQDGLHQAVEALENVPIQPGRESTTQITRQRYLQMYDQLSGLTGTAATVTGEFKSVYKCGVIAIPTNRKSQRKVARTRFFGFLDAKLTAIADEVGKRHKTGQPILVATRTIEESVQVNEILTARGLSPTVLNGVQDEEEADIVSQAGKSGSITIATNMAGRGTDIKPDAKAMQAGGLHVIGVSHNAVQRIDRQLIGRCARQGQPGSAQFFAAASDSLFEENNPGLQKAISRRVRTNGESADFTRELNNLQSEIEIRGFQQRQDMIRRDRWMDTVREAIEKD